jgi:hypothetical protein
MPVRDAYRLLAWTAPGQRHAESQRVKARMGERLSNPTPFFPPGGERAVP